MILEYLKANYFFLNPYIIREVILNLEKAHLLRSKCEILGILNI